MSKPTFPTNIKSNVAASLQFRKFPPWLTPNALAGFARMKLGRKTSCGWLRNRRFSSYKFRRQHPTGNYYLDFFCEEARLNVELDGSQHGFPDQRKHDLEREKFLQSLGIKTLRFWNSRLRRDKQVVRDAIFNELQARAPHPLPDYTKPKPAKDEKKN